MVLTADQQQVKALLTETITLLCKNGLHFQSEFSIEGLIGITLDQSDVFLISIKETIKCDQVRSDADKTSHMKIEQSKSSMTPNHPRGKKHLKVNDSLTSEKASNKSDAQMNEPSVSPSDSIREDVDSQNVKIEFSKSHHTEQNQPVLDEPSSVGDDRFCGTTSLPISRNSNRHVAKRIESEAIVSATFSTEVQVTDGHEPLTKRLCTSAIRKENLNKSDDRREQCDNDDELGGKACKNEPLDVVEIPDDEVESSLQSDNSYLAYMSMYASGGDGGLPADLVYPIQYDLSQMNQHSLPGCSSWTSGSRTGGLGNQDKSTIVSGPSSAGHWDKRWKNLQFSKNFQCRECGKVLSCYTSLKLHRLNIHNGLFQFTCPLCGKGLRRERDLRGHMATRHNMQKEFKCKICEKEFGYNYTLKDHMIRVHGINKFT